MLIPGIDTHQRSCRELGFTLLEMLAVIMLLAAATALVSLRMGAGGAAVQARALLLNSSEILRHARLAALRSGSEQVVYIDVAGRHIDSVGRHTIVVPREIEFAAVAAKSEQQADKTLGIRFFPDGTSTGGELKFVSRGRTYELHVNWLTGNVTINNG